MIVIIATLAGLIGGAMLARKRGGNGMDVEGMCAKLIDEANANGGNDNVTAICVRVVE